MKTKMKKLISIGTIPVLALTLLLVFGTVLADGPAVKPAPSLDCTFECDKYRAPELIFDSEGRLLVWEGTISGDIEGIIQWWFVLGAGPPNMPGKEQVKFYEARWEIHDGEGLLLAGDDAGTTATPGEKDGIWRGNGIVTEAYGEFEDWIGRRVYESGTVYWYPLGGDGIFRIN